MHEGVFSRIEFFPDSSRISETRIVIFSGVRGDTRRYRATHLYEQLSLAGADCTLSHLTDPALPRLVASASAVIVHRVPMDRYVEKLFRTVRDHNALLVLDADDYLYDPSVMRWIDSPDFQDPVRARLYQQELLRHRETLDYCDALTVSTDYLAGMLSKTGKPVYVHRNAYSQEMLSLSDQAFDAHSHSSGRVVIGYASGTHTHDKDFAMLKPVLCDILGRYPQAELWLMGAIDPGQGWGRLHNRIHAFPAVPWRKLPERLARLDINLAPLVLENPFSESKSEIKFMEAALVRVPTVASQTGAFAYAIRPRQTGFLADSQEEWYDALSYLVENTDARLAMGQAAYQDVLSRYAPLERGLAMLDRLSQMAEDAGRAAIEVQPAGKRTEPPFLFTAQDEGHPTMPEMALYSVRHRGLVTLLGQVWVFFRRKLAPVFPFRAARSE